VILTDCFTHYQQQKSEALRSIPHSLSLMSFCCQDNFGQHGQGNRPEKLVLKGVAKTHGALKAQSPGIDQ